MVECTLAERREQVGEEIGLSDWVEVDQAMIDQFAEATKDHQFIHVDPEAAAATPFGGTIAHGFLVLSLLSHLSMTAMPQMKGLAFGLNYGFDKVRMTSPVRAGARVRGRFTLLEMTERSPGQWMSLMRAEVEIENESKPAVVAEWRTLAVMR